jgi:Acetyltransferase (GNAT) domain
MNKPDEQIQTRTVCSAIELEKYMDCWEGLAKNAIEPNIFYEPAPLLAALRNTDKNLPFICLLIFQNSPPDQNAKEQLIGLFPFQYLKETHWPSYGVYQTFTHRHCYLSTPLVHKKYIAEALNCFFNWINSTPNGVKLFRLHRINGTGILAEAFQRKIKQNRQPTIHEDCYQRAFIALTGTAEEYISNSLSKHKHKEYRRLRRRLEDQGTLRLETTRDDQQHKWLDRFLALEASGWKGQHGHAIDNKSSDSGFFYDLIHSLGQKQRLILHTLWVDDHAIAMKCNLIAADGQSSFAFKIAYDENYSLFSPGVLLELDNIYDLFNQNSQLHWMDSCADPDHPMIDHLWRERRTIDDYFFGSRSISGRIKILLLKMRRRGARQGVKHNNVQ